MIDDLAEERIAAAAAALLETDAVLCFGVGCPLHGHCARYLAGDGVIGERAMIDTCRLHTWWPMFVDTQAR